MNPNTRAYIKDFINNNITICINSNYYNRAHVKSTIFDSSFLLSDVVWGKRCYSAVRQSACFIKNKRTKELCLPEQANIVENSLLYYNKLYMYRMR